MCAEDQERSGAEAKKVSQGASWAETRGRGRTAPYTRGHNRSLPLPGWHSGRVFLRQLAPCCRPLRHTGSALGGRLPRRSCAPGAPSAGPKQAFSLIHLQSAYNDDWRSTPSSLPHVSSGYTLPPRRWGCSAQVPGSSGPEPGLCVRTFPPVEWGQ